MSKKEDDINILYYFRILNKWKTQILIASIITAIISGVLESHKTIFYVAKTSVLLPVSQGARVTTSRIGSMLGVPSLSVGSTELDTIIVVMKSRRMARDIVEKFYTEYGKNEEDIDSYISMVQEMISVEPQANGLLITVKGKDPELITKIADFCVTNFDKLNMELALSSQKRMLKVLDPAVAYVQSTKEKVIQKIMLAALFATIIFSVVVFFIDYINRLKEEERK